MAISTTIDAIQPDIYVGTSPSSLTKQTDVYCNTVNQKIAPQMSQATLVHYYGRIATDGVFANVSSENLSGKYVEIKLSGTRIFLGIIASQTDEVLGTYETNSDDVPSGNNSYTAYSLDFLLDRVYADQSETEYFGTTKKLLIFNGESGTIIKNRSGVRVDNHYVFKLEQTSTNQGYAWTALDIAEYMLTIFGSRTGFTWTLTGQHEYLQHIIPPSLDPNGRTIRQILNELINPAYGFSWVADYGSAPSIRVFSTTDTEIEYNGSTIIPENPNTGHLGDNFAEGRNVTNARIQEVEQSAYSTIRVYSEPVRIVCTLKLGTDEGGLQKNWSQSQEDYYCDYASDWKRQENNYENVFTLYRLTQSWDRNDYLGNPVIPEVDESDMSVSFSADNPWTPTPFDRTLLMLNHGADLLGPRRKPFCLVYGKDEQYHLSDKVSYDGESAPPIGMSVTDEYPGIRLQCPYNHIIAKNTEITNSKYQSFYDYSEALTTVSFYSDAVLAYTTTGATTAIPKTKNIYIPGYHYWYVLNGTKSDPQYTAGPGTYQDDREALKKIGEIAKSWYGRVRNTVTYNVTNVQAYDYLSYVVTNIYTGGSFSPGGTVINSIDYDFLSQNIAVNTDFLDLDFSKMSKQSAEVSQKVLVNRINKIEEKIKNIPVRNVGGGAGSTIRLAKVKSKTDTWRYTADIYSNEDDDPIETDVVLKVNQNQLALGESIPVDAWFECVVMQHGTGIMIASDWTVIGLPRWLGKGE